MLLTVEQILRAINLLPDCECGHPYHSDRCKHGHLFRCECEEYRTTEDPDVRI